MANTTACISGVNGSVTLGMYDAKGKVSRRRKSPSGVQWWRPNRGSSGQTPKLILLLEMDVKHILRRKNKKCIHGQKYISVVYNDGL